MRPSRVSAKRLRRVLAIVALAVSTLVTGSALGDARTEARAHFKKGMEFIGAGRYDDGIGELLKAYEILPHPNVLYNIGRAYAEAGELEKAVEYFKKYIDTNPADKEEAQAVLTNLEARMRRQQQAAREAAQATQEKPPEPTPDKPPEKPPVPVAPPPEKPPAADIGQARTEDVFAESIVTASKGAQSPLDAANSTSIITEQDIRLSGITKIPSSSVASPGSTSWR